MPTLETRSLTDYAVLWEVSSPDGYGRSNLVAPIEIKVRWEGSRQESGNPQNTIEAAPVSVFVDRGISIGSILWKGRLRNLPTFPLDLFEVAGYIAMPDIKGRIIQRTLSLTRYSDSLPEVDA